MFNSHDKTGRLLLSTLALACLGGCYVTEVPVVAKGTKAPLEGTFECDDSINGGIRLDTYEEHKDGVLKASYSYTDEHGAEIKFDKMDDGLLLAQIEGEQSTFSYMYFDFADDDHIVVSIADVMSKGEYLEAMAEEHGLSSSAGSVVGEIVLHGDESDILDFLLAHDQPMLMTVASCARK